MKLKISNLSKTYSNGVKALEAGIMIDAYGKKIPIMAFTENKQVFFNFYLTIMLGKKW